MKSPGHSEENKSVLPSLWVSFPCFPNLFQRQKGVNHASMVTIHKVLMGPNSFLCFSGFPHTWCHLPILPPSPNNVSQESGMYLWKPPSKVMSAHLTLRSFLFSIWVMINIESLFTYREPWEHAHMYLKQLWWGNMCLTKMERRNKLKPV